MKRYISGLFCSLVLLLFSQCESDSDVSALVSNGQGGSLARFAVVGEYVYVVDDNSLISFSFTEGNMEITSINELNFGVETIFHYQGNLFIGSVDALYIYNLDEPSNPQFESIFQHEVSCDPVVVQDQYAYVSLRLLGCNQRVLNDVVEILDVSNVSNPKLISSYSDVQTPYGLGIKDDILFLCQNKNGLLLLDVSDKLNPTPIKTIDIQSYDVIINGNFMILIGDEGLFQYDISVPQNPQQLSLISTE